MANTYYTTTNLWICTDAGALNTGGVTVMKVVYIPAAIDDDLIITDSADYPAIVLKAAHVEVAPVQLDFGPKGRQLPSLKIGTIDGGTVYIYLKREYQVKI